MFHMIIYALMLYMIPWSSESNLHNILCIKLQENLNLKLQMDKRMKEKSDKVTSASWHCNIQDISKIIAKLSQKSKLKLQLLAEMVIIL